MCHMSNVRCQVSGVGVRCHVSYVRCSFFYFFFWTKFWSLLVEGISSLGPILSSLKATMVLNAMNEINIWKKKGEKKSCYHYRVKPVNLFSVTCVRKK